jgi:hypothetical protein
LQEGQELSIDCVAAYVGFERGKTFRLTLAVKNAFPGVYMKRVNKDGNKQYPYIASISASYNYIFLMF